MNLLKSRFRRTTAVVAGAIIGLGGAFALVSPASAHAPSVTGSTDCVKDGKWTIAWKFGNDYKLDATVKKIEVDPADATVTGDIQAEGKIVPAYSNNDADKQVSGSTTVDAKVDAVTVKVWLRWSDGFESKQPESKTVQRPDVCKPTTPPPATTPDEPTPILEQDCTTITIGLDNPAKGQEVTLKFETKKGETRTTVIKPGEKKTEKFSATPGFWVKVTPTGIKGATPETINYEKPADCATSGSAGGLPVTGAAAGTIAGGAGLLLVIGAVLFVVSRRRKLKFTA